MAMTPTEEQQLAIEWAKFGVKVAQLIADAEAKAEAAGFERGRLEAESGDVDEWTIPNLVAFVQRLARRLLQCQAMHGPGNEKMAKDALAFIERKGLRGPILRDDTPPASAAKTSGGANPCAACAGTGVCPGYPRGKPCPDCAAERVLR
jgi:hypothetical protein